jgi:membrane-bound inhibitor of C-type lysozyme
MAGLALGFVACERPAVAEAVNPPATVRTYRCADGQTITAGYVGQDTAVLTYKDRSYSLKLARSASGARYTGFGLQWWTKGANEAALAVLKPGEAVASAPGVACSVTGAESAAPPAPGAQRR